MYCVGIIQTGNRISVGAGSAEMHSSHDTVPLLIEIRADGAPIGLPV